MFKLDFVAGLRVRGTALFPTTATIPTPSVSILNLNSSSIRNKPAFTTTWKQHSVFIHDNYCPTTEDNSSLPK